MVSSFRFRRERKERKERTKVDSNRCDASFEFERKLQEAAREREVW